MKTKNGKKLLSLCLALVLVLALLPVSASASFGGGECGAYGNNLKWSLSDSGLLYIQGSGDMADYSAVSLAPWHNVRSQVKVVQMDSGVTSIGDYAFYECYALLHADLPGTLQRIGSHAFSGCVNLPKIVSGNTNHAIELPAWLTSIGSYAFEDCALLADTAFVLPAGVTVISEGMFKGCTGLTNIALAQGTTTIGASAFQGCTSLNSLSIPSTVTAIGPRAFQGCTFLDALVIPAGVTMINDYTFTGCSSLANVSLPATITSIGNYAFNGCSALRNLTIPARLAYIGEYAFTGCAGLTEVTLPAGVMQMGTGAFENCYGLTTMKIQEGLTFVPAFAFYNCSMLETIYLPASLTAVGINAFSGCGKLATLYYAGTRDQWKAVQIESGNQTLSQAAPHTGDDPVLPTVPVMLKAEATPGRITVTWQAAANAENYLVMRKTGSGGWQSMLQTKKTEYVDLNAKGGTVYTYTVMAYTSQGWGDYDPVGISATGITLIPLAVTGITPNKSDASIGETLTWKAVAQGNGGTIEYYFYIYRDGTLINRSGTYTETNTYSYVASAAGVYSAKVFARLKETPESNEEFTGGYVNVTAAVPLSLTGVTPNKTTANAGDTVTWTAASSGGVGTVQYCFYVFKDKKIVQRGEYGTAKTFSYPVSASGTWTVRVYAKDGSGAALQVEGGSVTVAGQPLSLKSVTANKSSANVGDTVTWTVTSAGGTSVQYCFYVFKDGKIAQRGSYGTAKTCSYKVTAPGTYTVRVYGKDGSAAALQLEGGSVTVAGQPLSLKSVTANKSTANVGDTVTWTVTTAGGSSGVKYCFYVFKDGKIAQRGSYGTAKTCSYKVTAPGTYTVRVYGKDGSAAALQLEGGSVTVAAPPLSLKSVTANKSTASVGNTVTWTVTTAGGSSGVKYCFYVFKDGKIAQRGSYGTAKTYSYKVTAPGTYTVRVYGKDGSAAALQLEGGSVIVAG